MSRFRLLIVGGGSIGERHLRCFLNTGRVQASVCDVNPRILSALVDRYNVEQTFQTIDDALCNHFDAAVICTPAPTHVPFALKLLQRRVHTLIEKPLAVSMQEVPELLGMRDQQGQVVAVAYVLRHHPVLYELKRNLEDGKIGRPVEVLFQSGQHFPYYRPAYRETYYKSRRTGGGAIQDALTHGVNAVEWLLGPIEQVVSQAAHQILPDVEVEDTVHALARTTGVLVAFQLNQHQYVNESVLTVHGEKGSLRANLVQQQLLIAETPGEDWRLLSRKTLKRDDLFSRQASAFLETIQSGRCPSCSLEEAVQTLRVSLAILESHTSGQWVSCRS